MTTKFFIDQDSNLVTVSGMVLAGSAEFKDHLNNSKILDPRIQAKVVAVVDVAYGLTQGLNQAIELSASALKEVTLVQQKKLISRFFEEIARDTGKVCFGAEDTMAALHSGAVETLVVWERLDLQRCTVMTKSTGEIKVVICKKSDTEKLLKSEHDEHEIMEQESLVDWLAEHYTEFGTQLELVQDTTAEGSQFCKGFGGLGGILRYGMHFEGTLGTAGKAEVSEGEDADDEDYWGAKEDSDSESMF